MSTRIIYLFILLLSNFSSILSSAQLRIERKIIIQNNQFYFFTVDNESQLATLFTGSIKQKLNKAQRRIFPTGRSTDEPFIPLAFDINNDEFVGINWITSSINSRYEAIKKISIKQWNRNRTEWTVDDWAQVACDMTAFTPNMPWEQMLQENNILENCFFDLIKSNKTIMAVTNQNQLRINQFDGVDWKLLATIPVSFTQYFTLIDRGNAKLGILDAAGNYFHVNQSNQSLELVKKSTGNKAQLLIVDKDKKKNYLIPSEAFEAASFNTITQLINESAIELNN